MAQYGLNEIKSTLGKYALIGHENFSFRNARAIGEADGQSLAWLNPEKPGAAETLKSSKAKVVLTGPKASGSPLQPNAGQTLLIVENPRRTFLRILALLFVRAPEPGVHPTAFVHPDAKIGENVTIGPFAYIGKSSIGNGTLIHGHVHLYDGISVGSRVIIHAGTVVGADGFGYERDENGKMEKFPHIGGVSIGDDVEIGANSCIDRGTLGNTQIHRGAKIDNLVHIAHNVIVGEDTVVIANAMIGGSTRIGERVWIAPSASLREGIQIGSDAVVGLGAVVTGSVSEKDTVMGSPARPKAEFTRTLKALGKLTE
jgi:UDP-3-O-[3-hydroxymyristoyl] glucosamine N-acyltransferase